MAPIRRNRGNGKSVVRNNAQGTLVRRVVRDVLLSQQELKRANTNPGNTVWTTAGAITQISQQIVQGDSIQGRSGDTISPKELTVNLAMVSIGHAYLGRVIIFQDMLNVGIDPTVAQVLDTASYIATYQPDTAQQHRFKILYDHTFSCDFISGVVTTTSRMFKEFKFKLKGKIRYNGATNVAASNGPGALYILFISDIASTNVTTEYYNYYTQLVYTDS